ncbi:MAG: triosephosphate isomerase [Candidatus Kerfeldbacteria bacterium]|nr:triosephosphate isomerase [Candidatus Kerfeldbacteria bacterium]
MKTFLIANWKLYVSGKASVKLARTYRSRFGGKKYPRVAQVLCPAMPELETLAVVLQSSGIALGAQTVGHPATAAATGDVSAVTLKEIGCRYVIVGHSERRAAGETDADITLKLRAAAKAGLVPILCVGEPASVRKTGRAARFVTTQLTRALNGFRGKTLLIAYEPVWAISKAGKGAVACPPETADTMRLVVERVARKAAAKTRSHVLYGGSVDGKNIGSYLRPGGFAGALIGFASTKPSEYARMVRVLSAQ